MFDLKNLLRENIANLKPYSSARDEYQGKEAVFLDANENPYGIKYNRYPDPLQREIKKIIAKQRNISDQQIFLGNGSDEPIDLIIRAFCEPGIDNIVAIEPTYGMYLVSADINHVEYNRVLLDKGFKLNSTKVLQACDKKTNLIFLCSPNNPTGNLLDPDEVRRLIQSFEGIVVLDEAYIDFSDNQGFLPFLNQFPNLVILQTFSKAWGMAAVRLGMAFASPSIIAILNRIKYPYNINQLTQEYVLESLHTIGNMKDQWVKTIKTNKVKLIRQLSEIPLVKEILPSDANFFLIRVNNPNELYTFLVQKKVIVRNRSSVAMCAGCLRITVGTEEENQYLVNCILEF